jgi:NADH dehydrogenase
MIAGPAALPDLPATARRGDSRVASPGLYCGVTEARRLRMRGFPAWLTHRTCHLLKVPAMNRRLRVVSGRTLAPLLRREVVPPGVLGAPARGIPAALCTSVSCSLMQRRPRSGREGS